MFLSSLSPAPSECKMSVELPQRGQPRLTQPLECDYEGSQEDGLPQIPLVYQFGPVEVGEALDVCDQQLLGDLSPRSQ